MPKKKYYVVWTGKTPGIYTSWQECQAQISGFPQAQYKSFPSEESAKAAFQNSSQSYIGKKQIEPTLSREELKKIGSPLPFSICVDGAASGKTKKIEYQGVFTETKTELFHAGPFEEGTNNIAEFLGLVHALAYCKKNNLDYPIYSDSRTAISWVYHQKVKTKLKRSSKNEKLFHLIERALAWLRKNPHKNKILKWETKAWGENPADFGRK